MSSVSNFKKVAFLGLGNMGRPMALNLIKAGLSVTVYDVFEAAMTQTLDEASKLQIAGGAAAQVKRASSPAQAVSEADLVISMLPSSPHVQDLYLGNGKLLEVIAENTTIIDCSTIAPDTAKLVAGEALKRRKLDMVDAPVSGGTAGAAGGTLTFIVGGTTEVFEKVKPILALMGKNIFHAGPNGTGQTAKICNNMLLAIHMIGTAEAINLGRANGMDPKILSEIMSKASGNNWSLQTYNPYPGVMENVPSSRGYQGGFAVDLMAKDLGLAQEAALSAKTSTPLGGLATHLYRMHSQGGHGRLDFSSILKFLDQSEKLS